MDGLHQQNFSFMDWDNTSFNDSSDVRPQVTFISGGLIRWGSCLIVMCLLGTALNLYVITLSCISRRYHRRPLALLILSQSAADLGWCLWITYEICSIFLPIEELLRDTSLGYLLCKLRLHHILLFYLTTVSNWSHLTTSYNRYCLCFKSVDRYNEIFSATRSARCVIGIWCAPILLCVMQITGILKSENVPFNCHMTLTNESFDFTVISFVKILFLILDFAPWVVSFFLLFWVYKALPDCNLTSHSRTWTKWTVCATLFRGLVSVPVLVSMALMLLQNLDITHIAIIFRQVRLCGAVVSPMSYAFYLKEYSLKRFRSRSNQVHDNPDPDNVENQIHEIELDFNLNDLLRRLAGTETPQVVSSAAASAAAETPQAMRSIVGRAADNAV